MDDAEDRARYIVDDLRCWNLGHVAEGQAFLPITNAIREAVASEGERCAKVAEDRKCGDGWHIAQAIRRGKE